MSEHPNKIWAGPCESSDGFISGKYCNGYEGMSYAREYIRADLAAEQIERLEAERGELVEILKAARCPDCDGSGVIPHGDPNGDFEIKQCRWCYGRDETLAQIDAQEKDDE